MIKEYLVKQVWAKTEESIADLGFDLIEVEFLRGKGRTVLRLYIDSEGGITVDDCATVSRHISTLLEIEGIVLFFKIRY